ncbi:metallophosphoesterase family protein [Desulfolithobacter sp.]
MEKLTRLTTIYFRRRTWFRLLLIVLILCFWAYIEIADLFPIEDHDLNFQALQTLEQRHEKGTFTFAFLADAKNSPVFSDVVRKLNNDQTLQFAIIGGDLVLYPDRDTFRQYLDQRRDLEIPNLTLPGNHDVAFHNMDMYYHIFGRMYYSFVLGDAKFILLDNSNETSLGDEQEAWLEKELKDGLQYKYRFVFMHVPLWDPRDKSGALVRYAHALKDADVARRLEDLFLRYRVTTLFTSHIHAWYDETIHGLHTIVSGGAGAELVGKDPEHTFYHYVRVTVGEQKVTTELVKIDKNITYSGMKKYMHLAGLYLLTFGRIYMKYVLMGFFILTLAVDGMLEFLYHRKHRRLGGVEK